MARGVRWSLLALGATLLLAGCGGNSDPGRTPAGLAQVQFLNAYATLHPAYQRFVPRARFVTCTRKAALGRVDSIEVIDVYDSPVEIPGSGRVGAKAVRVRLTSPDGGSATFVNHEVEVGSGWRWVLNAAGARAYRAGRCPGS
jgi:hypothetical protein